jgi:hypothetical protein
LLWSTCSDCVEERFDAALDCLRIWQVQPLLVQRLLGSDDLRGMARDLLQQVRRGPD